jgi:membrane dipeptidase
MVTHQRLTSFGAEVIRACHRLGFVCDVAHATEETVKQDQGRDQAAAAIAHCALGIGGDGSHPLAGRQISRDHARAVAETGGSVGIWHFFPSLDKYVDGLKEMVEVIGVDHVSIGTDHEVALHYYALRPQLVAAMLRGGFTPEDAGKIAGGNYMRIFRAAVG